MGAHPGPADSTHNRPVREGNAGVRRFGRTPALVISPPAQVRAGDGGGGGAGATAGAAGAEGTARTRTLGAAPGVAGAPGGTDVRHFMPPGIRIRRPSGTVHDRVTFFFIRMTSSLATSPES